MSLCTSMSDGIANAYRSYRVISAINAALPGVIFGVGSAVGMSAAAGAPPGSNSVTRTSPRL